MKKLILLATIVFTNSIYFNTNAQPYSLFYLITMNENMKTGERIFIENADKCLAIIEEAAQKMSVKGVAVIAFIPGDTTESWISKMKVVGIITNGSSNYLAVAYSKASEMAETYKNSGCGVREPMKGEFGFQGGVLKEVKSGYILAVFSGATGEQDVELANEGIDWLYKHY
ncbi:MAG: hypothetical protein KAS71_01745 [Bacteroidales bacterium]|nr:hypothetical protein [Bacteroidales bacterium]